MLASPEVGQMHIKTKPQEEEEPLSAVVTLQIQNAEWMERCLELDEKVMELEAELRKKGDWKQRGVSDKQSAELTVMSLHLLLYDSHALSRVWVRVPPDAAHFFKRKSDCLGCAVLLCFVVCLTLLASFFLPSFVISLIFVQQSLSKVWRSQGREGRQVWRRGAGWLKTALKRCVVGGCVVTVICVLTGTM